MERIHQVKRTTKETSIDLLLNLDGNGESTIQTGIGFFDHMLQSLARHGGFTLEVFVQGDLEVDGHHTVEDVGLCLGEALFQTAFSKETFKRFGEATIPMDEALVQAVVDVSGRSFLAFQCSLPQGVYLGGFDVGLTEEFFRALVQQARITLHIRELAGVNLHHRMEAIFKAVAHSLKQALTLSKEESVLSTKGTLVGQRKPRSLIAVVDYGMGNLHSVQKGLMQEGYTSDLVSDPKELTHYQGVILPGVGAFGCAMENLVSRGLDWALSHHVARGGFLLGICLGMQLLFSHSEESDKKGLQILQGQVRRLRAPKIPQMGWNTLDFVREDPLLLGLPTGMYAYFVHSYYVEPKSEHRLIETRYGETFASGIACNRVYGVQFHPEKSSKLGLILLGNFGRIVYDHHSSH